jgi:hypothetical protein
MNDARRVDYEESTEILDAEIEFLQAEGSPLHLWVRAERR